jgi:hypothetical protein
MTVESLLKAIAVLVRARGVNLVSLDAVQAAFPGQPVAVAVLSLARAGKVVLSAHDGRHGAGPALSIEMGGRKFSYVSLIAQNEHVMKIRLGDLRKVIKEEAGRSMGSTPQPRLAGTSPLTLAQALDMISLDKRELPRAWQGDFSARKAARRLEAEYGFAVPSLTAERVAAIWIATRG